MMKINPLIIKYAKLYLIVDIVFVIILFFVKDIYWVLNSQLAFISSLIIVLATFLSYKKNVARRIQNLDINKNELKEDRDKIDEIDDPYDLYTEYEQVKEEDLTPEKIKEIIKDEKSKVKRNSFKNTLSSSGSFVSLYRILGYSFLILSFFSLNNNQIFLPIAFLLGIGLVPFGVLISKTILK